MKKHQIVALLISATTLGAMVGSQTAMAAPSAAKPSPAARVVAELGHVRGLVSSASMAGVSTATAGQRASITLRGSNQSASSVSSGVAVTPDALPNIDAATITGANDVSNVFVLRDANASTNVTYTVSQAGHKLEADPLGGVLVINNATGQADGRISAPWAYDASGKSLPTSFTIAGDTVTERVDTTGAAFPVIADPHYTWGWISGTVYFNKHETAAIAASTAFLTAISAFAPPPFDIIFVSIAAAAMAYSGYLVAIGKCLKINTYGDIGSYSGSSGNGYCR